MWSLFKALGIIFACFRFGAEQREMSKHIDWARFLVEDARTSARNERKVAGNERPCADTLFQLSVLCLLERFLGEMSLWNLETEKHIKQKCPGKT